MENMLTLIVIVLLFVIIIMLFVIIIVWMNSRPKPPNPGPKPKPNPDEPSGIEVTEIHSTDSSQPHHKNLPVQVEDPSITDEQARAILSYSINDIEESRKKGWE